MTDDKKKLIAEQIAAICSEPVEDLDAVQISEELQKLIRLMYEEQWLEVYEARSVRYESLLAEQRKRSQR
tara:strand:+ start:1265 stop:1474 length:210 start_codon:yes stop_codon:yes gene_type:complete